MGLFTNAHRWVVNPMGGVWQPEKEKWRTIFDLTASGANDCLLPLECKYDTWT